MKALYYNDPARPEILPSHEDFPGGSGVVLFTRHSIRPPMLAGKFGSGIELNAEGIEYARQVGRYWGRRIARVSSSSSIRCMQTAQAMIDGAGMDLSVLHNPALGEPGAYISNVETALREFKDHDPLDLVNRMLSLESLRGHTETSDGSRILLESFFSDPPAPGKVHIEVTHDTILATLIYHLMGQERISAVQWPKMMEGALLWFNCRKLHWWWRGRSHAHS